MTSTIAIEGWRFLPHSYAIVNQFQCLHMLKISGIRLMHRDVPYFAMNWLPVKGLFEEADEMAIASIPSGVLGENPDVLLRMGFPYDFRPSFATRTFIFGTAEHGCVPRENIIGAASLREVMEETDFTLITPSNWSRQGFVRSGALPHRVLVVPHGVDPLLYRPLGDDERLALRERLGWKGFVFLTLGAMTQNKGMSLLLKAFASVARWHPEARLVLKGLNALYQSQKMLEEACTWLTPAEAGIVRSRLIWLGQTLAFVDVARLYQAADAYVSPYLAEGFNMPVLEASACGTLVICTRGGATDDFTTADFSLPIESEVIEVDHATGVTHRFLRPSGEHLLQQMLYAIEKPELRAKARVAGPAFVHGKFTWKDVTEKLVAALLPDLVH